MNTRRQFLKSLVAVAAFAPIIVKATPEPDFPFHDIGPRGVGKMTEREQLAVTTHMREYLGTDIISWKIPGKTDHCQGVAILDFSYMVTFKSHPRPSSRRVYIEAERMFTGKPSQALTEHVNAVWKKYMDKRTGRIV